MDSFYGTIHLIDSLRFSNIEQPYKIDKLVSHAKMSHVRVETPLQIKPANE